MTQCFTDLNRFNRVKGSVLPNGFAVRVTFLFRTLVNMIISHALLTPSAERNLFCCLRPFFFRWIGFEPTTSGLKGILVCC